ncbi:MAG: aminotransferase class V-fold PLP-dependent enzyme [Rhodospirillales bacterium]
MLTEDGGFPTDRHVAEGLQRLLPHVRVVAVPAYSLTDAIDGDTAVLLLCHVHFRSGARHDMAALTAAAHRAGALTLWDLSHSAGALAVDLNGARRGYGRWLRLQVPERWAGRAGVSLSFAKSAGGSEVAIAGMDRACGAFRVFRSV